MGICPSLLAAEKELRAMNKMLIQCLFQLLIFFNSLGCLFAEANPQSLLLKELHSPQVHWLDLPKDALEKIGNLSTPAPLINQLIQQYHSVKKTDPSTIAIRISYLKEIANLLSKHIETESNLIAKKFLTNVCRTAEEKSRYLEALNDIRIKFITDPNYIENYVYDLAGNNPNKILLFLVNERRYDSKLRIYWGEYFLEVIDPCHRFLTSYYDLWLETNPLNKDYFPFFMWLEDQNVNFELTAVRYFTNVEKDQCEVIVKGGKLVKKMTGEVLSCCQEDQEYLFIIDLDERIYIAKGSKEVRHTSLSYGKPVLAAGNIIVKQGIICRLGLESGHYQPNISNGLQLLNMLLDHSAVFSLDAAFDFYHNGEKQTLLLADFMAKAIHK